MWAGHEKWKTKVFSHSASPGTVTVPNTGALTLQPRSSATQKQRSHRKKQERPESSPTVTGSKEIKGVSSSKREKLKRKGKQSHKGQVKGCPSLTHRVSVLRGGIRSKDPGATVSQAEVSTGREGGSAMGVGSTLNHRQSLCKYQDSYHHDPKQSEHN